MYIVYQSSLHNMCKLLYFYAFHILKNLIRTGYFLILPSGHEDVR